MSLEELTPRERQIFYCGYKEGKKDGKSATNYLFIGYVLLFVMVVKLLTEK